ncbi:MAG: M15 family metallopeptidase [Ruminococcus sp.]|nr:M15 family metallopeptidase [Ruminococcus sp.]
MEDFPWRSILDDGKDTDAVKDDTEQSSVNDEPVTESENAPVYDEEYTARIRADIESRRALRREAERKRIMRNRIIAVCVLVLLVIILFKACTSGSDKKDDKSTSSSSAAAADTKTKKTTKKKSSSSKAEETEPDAEGEEQSGHKIETIGGMTFVDNILIVNKTYSLPADYAPGVSEVAQNAFNEMAEAASYDGISLWVNSSYRSYEDQEYLYNSYANERGVEAADEVSSRPGHSEHQSGLAFDVNTTEDTFAGTPEAEWLAQHCSEYGFIIRFPEGKESSTGYAYEPWHIRYLGTKIATEVTQSGLSLEEYLGVTSSYDDAEDMQG